MQRSQAAVFDLRWRKPETLITVDDYRRVASRRLPEMIWSYVDGGADDLITLEDNRAAFKRWTLRPRMLAGIKKCDLGTTVAGEPVSLPVLLAPTGLAGLSHWRGDIAAARAAERCGTRYILSTASSWTIEEVAEASSADHFFQLYARSGPLTESLLRRAWDSGNRVMFLTVDTPVVGNRVWERKAGMGRPPVLTPGRVADVARHPRWLYRTLRYRRVSGRNLVAAGGFRAAGTAVDIQVRELMQATLTWDDAAWVRDLWPGKLFVKGILEASDAQRALELGFDGVVVSNHGGRQLDGARATLDCLPEIVAAVGERMEVLLDGGIRRGSDVAKALALGARAVLVGRPYLYGLAADGEAGVAAVLEIFREELERTLTLMGVSAVRDLGPDQLARR
jgi:isopentenyl diphosphate isomerase/L-lactate dehydrogenase-like FMN-dependent dehydrogenase